MSKKAKYPEPSPAERMLAEEQAMTARQQRQMIEDQYRTQNLLSPFLYKAAGIKPVYGEDKRPGVVQKLGELYERRAAEGGDQYDAEIRALEAQRDVGPEITSFEEIPGALEDPEAAQIEQMLQERTLAALKGELPLDAGLLREIGDQEKALRQSLEKQLGPGYETSTPGIEALAQFTKRRGELLDAARRGDITLGEQLSLAREQNSARNTADFLAQTSGVNSIPFQAISALGQNSQLYGNPLAWWANERRNKFGERLQPGSGEGIGSLAGTLIGTAAGAYFGGPQGAMAGGSAGGSLGQSVGKLFR